MIDPSLRRKKPLPRHRTKPRRGQPSSREKAKLRGYIYGLSEGRCELQLHSQCSGQRILPWNGPVTLRWHLVHIRAKRRFGWPIEGPHRMRGGCYPCHIIAMHQQGLKPKTLMEPTRPSAEKE